MGVFRGEFFFFSRLSIKFARVGVASNILPKKVFLENKRTHAFADDILYTEKTGPPAPSIPNAVQLGSPKFTNITTPPPNPSSRTTKTLNGSRVKSPTGFSYPITRFWGLWRRKLWCWRGLRCRICRARLGGI